MKGYVCLFLLLLGSALFALRSLRRLGCALSEPARPERGVRRSSSLVLPHRRMSQLRSGADRWRRHLPTGTSRSARERQSVDLLCTASGRCRDRSVIARQRFGGRCDTVRELPHCIRHRPSNRAIPRIGSSGGGRKGAAIGGQQRPAIRADYGPVGDQYAAPSWPYVEGVHIDQNPARRSLGGLSKHDGIER